jgi:hypothetical protein
MIAAAGVPLSAVLREPGPELRSRTLLEGMGAGILPIGLAILISPSLRFSSACPA